MKSQLKNGARAGRTRLALVAVVSFALVLAVPALASHHARSGSLHVTKECSQYNGEAGSFCTIKSSNLKTISTGSKVFYLEATGADGLDSDVVLYSGPGNAALGHVTLSYATSSGVLKLSGGTGKYRGFHAKVVVTYDPAKDLWHWDGTYHFRGHKN